MPVFIGFSNDLGGGAFNCPVSFGMPLHTYLYRVQGTPWGYQSPWLQKPNHEAAVQKDHATIADWE